MKYLKNKNIYYKHIKLEKSNNLDLYSRLNKNFISLSYENFLNSKKFFLLDLNFNINIKLLINKFFFINDCKGKTNLITSSKYFVSNGLFLKSYNYYLNTFKNLYYFFRWNLFSLEKYKNSYIYLDRFLINYNINNFFNNINYIFNWVISWGKPIFIVKSINSSKKNKRRLKRQYKHTVVYLKKYKRIRYFWFYFAKFQKSYSNNIFSKRLFLSFTDTIFNYKASNLYKQKLNMYKKVFLDK